MSLKTQQSVSTATSSYATQRPRNFHAAHSSISSIGSPLPNPHSLVHRPESTTSSLPNERPALSLLNSIPGTTFSVVDDMTTPDPPPSETLLYATDPGQQRIRGRQMHDEDEDITVSRSHAPYTRPHTDDEDDTHVPASYSHVHTPRHPFAHTPRGIPQPQQDSTRPVPHSQTQHTQTHEYVNRKQDVQQLSSSSNNNRNYPYSSHTLSNATTSQPFVSFVQQQHDLHNLATAPSPPSPSMLSTLSLGSAEPPPHSHFTTTAAQAYRPDRFPVHDPRLPSQPLHALAQHSHSQSTAAAVRPPPPTTAHSQSVSEETVLYSSNRGAPEPSSSYQPYQPPAQVGLCTDRGVTQSSERLPPPHSYPHSLAGLHVLPTSPPRNSSLFSKDARLLSNMQINLQPHVEAESPAEPSNAQRIEIVFRPDSIEVPSLGFLDEALSFIATERANAEKARIDREANTSKDVEADQDEEGEDDIDNDGADGDWKHVLDGEPNSEPGTKRKRRRKRSSKNSQGASSGQDAPSGSNSGAKTVRDRAQQQQQPVDGGLHPPPPPVPRSAGPITSEYSKTQGQPSAAAPPNSSPKKKRSKSAAPSSGSTSVRSLLVDAEKEALGTMTPGGRKHKVKEKAFLLPPASITASDSTSSASKVESASGKGKERKERGKERERAGGEKEKEKEKERQKAPIIILKRPTMDTPIRRPNEGITDSGLDVDSDFGDGGRTPTNALMLAAAASSKKGKDRQDKNESSELASSSPVSLNLAGKRGRRVGRREREREKTKFDSLKGPPQALDGSRVARAGTDPEFDDDDDDDEEDDTLEEDEVDDDLLGENDSISNMSILQAPKSKRRSRSRSRKAKDRVHIHSVVGRRGVYKSTPNTPSKISFVDKAQLSDAKDGEDTRKDGTNMDEEDVFGSTTNSLGSAEKEKKKRVRPKRSKALNEDGGEVADGSGIAKSRKGKSTQLDKGEEVDGLHPLLSASSVSRPNDVQPPAPDSKRGRLLALARQLKQSFPEQRQELSKVIQRIEGPAASSTSASLLSQPAIANESSLSSSKSTSGFARPSLVSVSGKSSRKKFKKGHVRALSEGTINENLELGDHTPPISFAGVEEEDEDDEEIDVRGRAPRKNDVLIHVFIDHSNILIGLLSYLKRSTRKVSNLSKSKPPTVLSRAMTTTGIIDKTVAASAFAAVKVSATRPLPVPMQSNSKSMAKPSEAMPAQTESTLIPLPSFATMSRSLPSGSILSAYMARKETGNSSEDAENLKANSSDGYDYTVAYDNNDATAMVGNDTLFTGLLKLKDKKKKAPKHLWHAALALILERGRPVTRRVVVTSSPLYQPMESIERLGYELRVYIRVPDLGDGMDRERFKDKKNGKPNSGTPMSVSGPPSSSSRKTKRQEAGHVRQISGNTSAESGGGYVSGGGSNPHPYLGLANDGTPPPKIKYREQGVDELLQLKLHQAVAAADIVPEGSTIVLATGDGNMGQFSEDGFLGPIRTALKRGWKVELYAWEEGLSRAWRREFGESTEWGKKGMFRVIGMEQFASGLVEAAEWA